MYKSYLLIENPSKSNILGPILRCCAAYAVSEVVFVGYSQCSADGSHGSARQLQITAKRTFDQALQYLKGKDCGVLDIIGLLGGISSSRDVYDECGYEVDEFQLDSDDAGSKSKRLVSIVGNKMHDWKFPPSKPVHCRPFRGNTAFLMSKSWRGLPVEQALLCDAFVHIPHMPIQQSQAMVVDVQASLSIVLHHWTAWAGYDERMYIGHKFEVSQYRKGEVPEEEKRAKAALRAKSRDASDNVLEELACEDMFGSI